MELRLLSVGDLIAFESDGEKGGAAASSSQETISVPDLIFGLQPRHDLIHRMVMYQLAKRQAGTHFAKTRADVSRTGKKSVRQKGSGGARHGSRRVNIFRGGGKAFGPVVRSHAIDLPKKIRAIALIHALSARAQEGAICAFDVEKLSFKDSRTKLSRTLYERCCPEQNVSCLILDDSLVDDNVHLSARNLGKLSIVPREALNVYDVMRYDRIIFTQSALKYVLEIRFSLLKKLKKWGNDVGV